MYRRPPRKRVGAYTFSVASGAPSVVVDGRWPKTFSSASTSNAERSANAARRTQMCHVDGQHAQAPVHVAAVTEADDRLLPGIAALREAHVRLVEPGLGGEDPV